MIYIKKIKLYKIFNNTLLYKNGVIYLGFASKENGNTNLYAA